MPLILAVDTTSERGSLALLRGGELLEEAPLDAPTGYSHLLYGALEALLARHAVTLAEIDCFASGAGPATFTGVRVSLACVKGLAEALGRPAVAVSNLEALARFGTARLRGAVLDARRGDLYGAVYDADGRQVTKEVVAAPAAWLAALPAEVEEFLTTGFPLTVEAPRRVVVAPAEMAAQIARIAAERLERGEAVDPAALDANYVRRSDAELFWKEY
jgi:tRNA threonylcarbamoyladenosine biosynthesis protein TsaB